MNQETKPKGFMSGKKKLTASLFLPIAAVIINTFVADLETAETLVDLVGLYLPTLIVMITGWFYTANEAAVDKDRAKKDMEVEKTKQLEVQKATAVAGVQSEVLEEVEAELYYEPFDEETFDKKVVARAKWHSFVDNPLTQFQAARDKALIAPCKSVNKAKSFWYYYTRKGLGAFEFMFGFPYAEASENLSFQGKDGKACTVPDLEFLAIELGFGHYKLLEALKAAQRNLSQVSQLEQDMVAWVHPQTRAPLRWTLWTVGERAGEILRERGGHNGS